MFIVISLSTSAATGRRVQILGAFVTAWIKFRWLGVLAGCAIFLLASLKLNASDLIFKYVGKEELDNDYLNGLDNYLLTGFQTFISSFPFYDHQDTTFSLSNMTTLSYGDGGVCLNGVPRSFIFTNTSGLYHLQVGSNFTGGVPAITPYQDLFFIVKSFAPGTETQITNLKIDGVPVGSGILQAHWLVGGTINDALQGLRLSGAGNTWSSITGQITFTWDTSYDGNSFAGDFNSFQIWGLTTSLSSGNLNTLFTKFRTASGLASDGSQDLLTPAGDGVPNLYKFAFNMIGSGPGQAASLSVPNNLSAGLSGSAGLPFSETSVNGQTQLRWTYIRRKASTSPGITYLVEFCDDLVTNSWAVNPSASESAVDIDSTFERVTVTDSVTGAGKRFFRVRVTVP